MGRIATSLLAVLSACGSEHDARQPRESTRLEIVLEGVLSERVGVAVRVRCVWMPPSCRVYLPDATTMRVRLGANGTWWLDGRLMLADDIEAYLRDVVTELGAPQVARCGARIRAVQTEERVECALQRGGRAFVIANEDGTSMVEVQLEKAAGDARSEVVTIERDAELEQMSSKLDGANAEQGEDE